MKIPQDNLSADQRTTLSGPLGRTWFLLGDDQWQRRLKAEKTDVDFTLDWNAERGSEEVEAALRCVQAQR